MKKSFMDHKYFERTPGPFNTI